MIASVLGLQEPRFRWVPTAPDEDAGLEAIELAESCGLDLDPWQKLVLVDGMRRRSDGLWGAFEVGVNVPRQNGKGGILEARELAALFGERRERLTIHSAHEFPTSMEAFLRMEELIEANGDLSRQVKTISRSHGSEGFKLVTGERLSYRTRTKGGGRGFSADLLILDEAMILSLMAHAALLPTLSARLNPQVWYTGSPVDEERHKDGLVFTRVRARGIQGGDPRLAYFEWTAGEADAHASSISRELLDEVERWAAANPGLGIRITEEHVASELRSMDARTFAVERLGIGAWPDLSLVEGGVIPLKTWESLADPASEIANGRVLAFDVTPLRTSATISEAGARPDALTHIGTIDHRAGTGWVVPRLASLVADLKPSAVLCDAAGPAASLISELEQAGVMVTAVDARDMARACGLIFDKVSEEEIRHRDTPEMRDAIRGAVPRPLGDAWAWSRKNSGVDISPLVASTLALWAATTMRSEVFAGAW